MPRIDELVDLFNDDNKDKSRFIIRWKDRRIGRNSIKYSNFYCLKKFYRITVDNGWYLAIEVLENKNIELKPFDPAGMTIDKLCNKFEDWINELINKSKRSNDESY